MLKKDSNALDRSLTLEEEIKVGGTYNSEGPLPIAQRTSLREIVYIELYNRIIDGIIPSKSRLNEAKIAKQMGISRGPVREAIRQLEQDGIVVPSPGKGTFVKKLTARDLHDCYGVRKALESLAIGLLIERVSHTELDSLRKCITEMRKLRETDREMHVCTWRFHATICQLSGNKALEKAWKAMSSQIRSLGLSVLNHVYKDANYVAQSHDDILDAILSGNSSIAQRVIQDHISEAETNVLKVISETNTHLLKKHGKR